MLMGGQLELYQHAELFQMEPYARILSLVAKMRDIPYLGITVPTTKSFSGVFGKFSKFVNWKLYYTLLNSKILQIGFF